MKVIVVVGAVGVVVVSGGDAGDRSANSGVGVVFWALAVSPLIAVGEGGSANMSTGRCSLSISH